jgi:4-amino-4-deoxy-L-arabinose transferase-like glycosyltransferase
VLAWLFGPVSELTAVVPSVVGLVAVIIYRLGSKLRSVTAGRYAAIIAASTQNPCLYERPDMPDMLLTGRLPPGVCGL